MQIDRDNSTALFQITACETGKITVNEQTYAKPLLMTPTQLIALPELNRIDDLKPEHFEILLSEKPELVLVGTGETHRFLNPSLYRALIEKQIGIEIMNTKAACRTYSLLAAEGRLIAALLLLNNNE